MFFSFPPFFPLLLFQFSFFSFQLTLLQFLRHPNTLSSVLIPVSLFKISQKVNGLSRLAMIFWAVLELPFLRVSLLIHPSLRFCTVAYVCSMITVFSEVTGFLQHPPHCKCYVTSSSSVAFHHGWKIQKIIVTRATAIRIKQQE